MGNTLGKKRVVDGDFIIEIVSALRVPDADVVSEPDPYIRIRAVGENGEALTDWMETAYCRDTNSPVWHSYRHLGIDIYKNHKCKIQIELMDKDPMRDDHLGSGEIFATKISGTGVNIPLFKDEELTSCQVKIRAVRMPKTKTKVVYLIRHGESKWNGAVKGWDVRTMVSEVDHPLTANGVEQAENLHKKWVNVKKSDASQYEREFLTADRVFSSPLSRALQTGLLVLRGHPTITRRGIVLLRQGREVKNFFSMDTVGKASGKTVVERAVAELKPFITPAVARKCLVKVDHFDAVGKWWTRHGDLDKEAEVKLRQLDFLSSIHFMTEKVAVFAGHSIFFRALLRNFAAESVLSQTPDFAKKKMENGACLRVVVNYADFANPIIEDAKFMFGTSFKNHRAEDEESSDEEE